ncbi:hypothetical protein OXV74_02605 [Bacteroides thetaiotaomicron]|nr:hypothetical protein [Bacteroides thetaiotaomicron]
MNSLYGESSNSKRILYRTDEGEKVELKASGLMKNWVKENKYPMYGKQPCPMSSSETIICMLTKSLVTGSMTSFIF